MVDTVTNTNLHTFVLNASSDTLQNRMFWNECCFTRSV